MQTAVPESTHRGRTHSWNVAFERRIPLGVSVDVAYVGNRLVGGLPPSEGLDDQHQLRSAPGRRRHRSSVPTVIRPSEQHRDLFAVAQDDLHALQVGVTRPFTQGLLLKGHYTLGRSMALRNDYELPTSDAQDRNWALANSDRTHVVQMAAVYQLPWRSEDSHSIARMLINDWQSTASSRRSAARRSPSRPMARR